MDCEDVSVFSCSRLLHPELFSLEEIMQILRTYCIADSKLNCLSHEELLNLFNRVALPLPQRIYSENFRRGKLLMSLRLKQQSSAKNTSSGKPEKTETKILIKNNGIHSPQSNSGSSISTKVEKLKPPVDLINYERKKINLTKVTKPTSQPRKDGRSDLEKIVIKSRHKETAETVQKNQIKSEDSNEVVLKRPVHPSDSENESAKSVSKKAKILVS